MDRPSALTIPQEENEILSSRLDGLQLLSNIQGLGCLAVPKGWVFLFNWPRGEWTQVASGSPLCRGVAGRRLTTWAEAKGEPQA